MLLLALALIAPASAAVSHRASDSCHSRACEHRVIERHYRHVWRMAPAAIRAHLQRISNCESGGSPHAISPSGLYRGKYQFAFATWLTVGGRGDPARASEHEQDARAVRLYRIAGPGQWPVCSRK